MCVLSLTGRKKLVAFGSDGAAVMTGRKYGAVAKFREVSGQHIVGVHCMAHRLELAYKDAMSKNMCHVKLEELLLGLYYFYHNSPLNRANLKRSFEMLSMRTVIPTRVGGTRWMGHVKTALDHFLRGYAAIV